MTELETPAGGPEQTGGGTVKRIAVLSTLGLAGLIVLVFGGALILAINDLERAGRIIQLVRDFLIIVISLEGVLILFAVVVLIVQIARSVNLVQTEVRPVLENAQDATKAVKDTAEFVGTHAVELMIRVNSFIAGLRTFLRELGDRRDRREKQEALHDDPTT
jgi:hypothetical protein